MTDLPHCLSLPLTTTNRLGALYVGDSLHALRELRDASVDLVVTSPPYDRQPKYGNGESYRTDWYHGTFLKITQEIRRILAPRTAASCSTTGRSGPARSGERSSTNSCSCCVSRGFSSLKTSCGGSRAHRPGGFNHFLKDAVEYCFQFTKSDSWQFFPEQCLSPARWDRKDVERRKKLPHNYQRANAPSGQGRKRVQAGPDLVRPSTLLAFEPEFQPNPTRHPARFPVTLPDFFIRLLTRPGHWRRTHSPAPARPQSPRSGSSGAG